MDKSFSVMVGGDQGYRDRWEATFGRAAPNAGVEWADGSTPTGLTTPSATPTPSAATRYEWNTNHACHVCGAFAAFPCSSSCSRETGVLRSGTGLSSGKEKPRSHIAPGCTGYIIHSEFESCPVCD